MSDVSAQGQKLLESQRLLLALQEARVKLEEFEQAKSEPIAIIGMGCRFPGQSNTPEEFWQLLRNGVDAIIDAPSERWDVDKYYDPDPEAPGKMYVRHGGFLSQIDRFDAQFFGISPRQALSMDPHQRLVLEVGWEAIENAGQSAERLRDSSTGVFMGIAVNDYARLITSKGGPQALVDPYLSIGNSQNGIPGRLSYTLGLCGPSIAIDTACSSSLVAVHLACQSLRNRESNLALAGGVNLMVLPESTIALCKTRMLSPDGRCRTFDEAASGMGRSEGCGIIVLKRLSDALRDEDPILALIRSSAVNQDGPSSGFTVPSKIAQEALMRQTLVNARLEPTDIDYVEAHGTGTPVGDPIEVQAVSSVFAAGRSPEQPLLLGSVKANIGHPEASAGIAGLIKTVLALQNELIPAQIHLHNPNPYIPWQELSVHVPLINYPWPRSERPRIAGVNSFGFSGTNAHLLLEEAPLPVPRLASNALSLSQSPHLLVLSAKTPTALQQLAERYVQKLTEQPQEELSNVCFSAATGRTHLTQRLSVVAATATEAAERLRCWSETGEASGVQVGKINNQKPTVVFLFSGQGSQGTQMGRQLYAENPVFRQAMQQCESWSQEYLPRPLLTVLYAEEHQEEYSLQSQPVYVQVGLFALEYALVQLWRSWGVEPSAVLGHSVGEYVAACVAGVLSAEDALYLVAERARLMQTLPSDGAMAAVFASPDAVMGFVEASPEHMAIAAINGPEETVLSGSRAAVTEAVEKLTQAGIQSKELSVSHAFHSPLMNPILDQFEKIANVSHHSPQCTFVSSLTGGIIENVEAQHWRKHLRETVRFADGLNTLLESGRHLFVEIGPHSVLSGMGSRLTSQELQENTRWVPSLRRGQPDRNCLLDSLTALYIQGIAVDWHGFYGDTVHQRISLPNYPFQQERYWPEDDNRFRERQGQSSQAEHPLLGQQLLSPLKSLQFESLVSGQTPFLKDYQVHKQSVFPAAAYLEMALSAAAKMFPDTQLQLQQIHFLQPLSLNPDRSCLLQTVLTPTDTDQATFEIFGCTDSEPGLSGAEWSLYARGLIQTNEQTAPSLPTLEGESDSFSLVDPESLYERLQQKGLDSGPLFQTVRQLCQIEDGLWQVQTELSSALAGHKHPYLLHPALLDGCWQVLSDVLGEQRPTAGVHLPIMIEQLHWYRKPNSQLNAHVHWQHSEASDEGEFQAELMLFDQEGTVAKLTGLKLAITEPNISGEEWLHQLSWREAVAPAAAEVPALKRWLIFSDGEVGEQLAERLRRQGAECVLVQPGEKFSALGTQQYQLMPMEASQYSELLEHLAEKDWHPQAVVHLWSLRSETEPDWMQQQQLVCGSSLYLVQALSNTERKLRLWITTQGGQACEASVTSVAQSTVWGLCRVLAQEHPGLVGVCVDLEDGASASRDQLWEELGQSGQERQVAYRQGKRYVARVVPYQATTQSPAIGTSLELPLQSQASYLITGGLGSLGLQLAHWLAAHGAEHLVLVSRSQPSEEVLAQLQPLKEGGTQLLLLQADISCPEQVEHLLQTIERQAPPLRGIIHAAGVLDNGLLQQIDWTRLERVLAAKAHGAWLLHKKTEQQSLDFFVLFSSIASLFAGIGQGSYAAANAYLDSLAHYRRQKGMAALSINWGPWSETGMAARMDSRQREGMEQSGMGWVNPKAGLRLFGQLLQGEEPQVGVLPVRWEQFLQIFPQNLTLLEALAAGPTDATVKRNQQLLQQLRTAPTAQRRELLTSYISQRVNKALGAASVIEIDQPLNYAGFDSLMAVEIKSLILAELDIDLPMHTFIEGISIGSLTELLLNRLTVMDVTSAEPSVLEVGSEMEEMTL
jgi:acyl transferase domain-containing protein/acyl carrier protein